MPRVIVCDVKWNTPRSPCARAAVRRRIRWRACSRGMVCEGLAVLRGCDNCGSLRRLRQCRGRGARHDGKRSPHHAVGQLLRQLAEGELAIVNNCLDW